ncbi:MAG TPA: hypothetical protein EYQ24_15340 [Bacteroidetes bacterium]|nr:hypothetical protein [Bacteroidota bacterium]
MRAVLLLLALLFAVAPAYAQTADSNDDIEVEGSICAGVPDGLLIAMVGGTCAILGVGIMVGCAPVARPRETGDENGPARGRRGVGLVAEEADAPPRDPSRPDLLDSNR